MLKLSVRFTPALALAFLVPLAVHAAPAHPHSPAQTQIQTPSHSKKKTHSAAAPAPAKSAASNTLEQLTRDLKLKNATPAYTKLSAIANAKSGGVTASRAALALGYYDLGKQHYPQASQWLTHAMNDPLLRDYALFYSAQTNLELNRNAEALAQLKQYRKENPDSVLTDQAVQSLATAALAANQPGEALVALDAYPDTKNKPALLLLRGDAHAAFSQPLQAAVDYQTIYLKFPTSDVAGKASEKLSALRSTLGGKFPVISLQHQIEHANTIYGAHQWSTARNEYSQLVGQATGADKERAELRILSAGVSLGASPVSLIALSISDPDVDAERYYIVANHYRAQGRESDMAAAIESAASRAPQSSYTESALFLGGNYFWLQLDRDRAATYYKRLADSFPTSPDANSSDWRVAWAATIKRRPNAAALIIAHLNRFPGSPYTSDALYWLGRLAEESQDVSLARAYYQKLQTRYPQNYFTQLATARFRVIGHGPGSAARCSPPFRRCRQ